MFDIWSCRRCLIGCHIIGLSSRLKAGDQKGFSRLAIKISEWWSSSRVCTRATDFVILMGSRLGSGTIDYIQKAYTLQTEFSACNYSVILR